MLSREQAIGAGVSRHIIAGRIESGQWQRLHRGVFAAFSGPVPRDAVLWGAVLRAGGRAVLSHYTAAELWKLSDESRDSIHVSVPRDNGTLDHPGLVVHYASRLPEARHPSRLPPLTRVEETVLDLVDLARTAEDAVAWPIKACQRRLTTPGRMTDALQQRKRVRWRGDVGDAIAVAGIGVHSPLELRYFRDVERKHGLVQGDRQALVTRGAARQYLDVRYSEYGVVVELDGVLAHSGDNRKQDARRDNANTIDGYRTLRYGWVPVAYHACETAQQVFELLKRNGYCGTLRRCGKNCGIS